MKKAVLISCFNWYEKRLKPIKEILEKLGYEVDVLNADYNHILKKTCDKKLSEITYFSVPKYKKNISIQRIYSHLYFSNHVYKWLKENNPDLIYALLPPNSIAYYCAKYKKKNQNVSICFDLIDMWPESMPISNIKNTLPARFWADLRNKNLQYANHIFVECNLYKRLIKQYVNDASIISPLYLYKEQSKTECEMVQHMIKMRSNGSRQLVKLAYVGSMNHILDINGIKGLVYKIMSQGYSIEVHAIGDGESRDVFISMLKNAGCNVYYYGKIFDEIKKIELLGSCDYALNMMKSNVEVGLTIKSIDYFSMGLPIINNIKGDTWDLVKTYNIGINYSDKFQLEFNVNAQDVISVYNDMFTVAGFKKQLIAERIFR